MQIAKSQNGFERFLNDEKGLSLVVSVTVLVLLTMIGLGLVTSSNLAIDVAGNQRERAVAYNAAEACVFIQMEKVKNSGPIVGAIASHSLGGGISCSATTPTSTGTFGGGGIPTGYSMEEGSTGVGYINFTYSSTGTSAKGTQATVFATIAIATGSGGY